MTSFRRRIGVSITLTALGLVAGLGVGHVDHGSVNLHGSNPQPTLMQILQAEHGCGGTTVTQHDAGWLVGMDVDHVQFLPASKAPPVGDPAWARFGALWMACTR